MSEKLKEYLRQSINELLKSLPVEERLKGLPAEERLKGLSVEEVIGGLSPEMLEALTRRLNENDSSQKPK
jgi:hypothetical protein